jgi:hypothetical protein
VSNLRPISLREARRFVGEHHRHNLPPRGWLFGVALEHDGAVIGVGIAGRPVARKLQDGVTVEVLRICTLGDHNACSTLYGALCRAAKALGYRRAITYTLASETGASVRAAGFQRDAELDPHRGWDMPSRPRATHDLFGAERAPLEAKVRWVRHFDDRKSEKPSATARSTAASAPDAPDLLQALVDSFEKAGIASVDMGGGGAP